ncbi:MAG TPA: hypothetical protein VJK54_03105 [Chthoniobacterales bacterium]|nr:hypothetical protein [Chthoniobacterales bacterium]
MPAKSPKKGSESEKAIATAMHDYEEARALYALSDYEIKKLKEQWADAKVKTAFANLNAILNRKTNQSAVAIQQIEAAVEAEKSAYSIAETAQKELEEQAESVRAAQTTLESIKHPVPKAPQSPQPLQIPSAPSSPLPPEQGTPKEGESEDLLNLQRRLQQLTVKAKESMISHPSCYDQEIAQAEAEENKIREERDEAITTLEKTEKKLAELNDKVIQEENSPRAKVPITAVKKQYQEDLQKLKIAKEEQEQAIKSGQEKIEGLNKALEKDTETTQKAKARKEAFLTQGLQMSEATTQVIQIDQKECGRDQRIGESIAQIEKAREAKNLEIAQKATEFEHWTLAENASAFAHATQEKILALVPTATWQEVLHATKGAEKAWSKTASLYQKALQKVLPNNAQVLEQIEESNKKQVQADQEGKKWTAASQKATEAIETFESGKIRAQEAGSEVRDGGIKRARRVERSVQSLEQTKAQLEEIKKQGEALINNQARIKGLEELYTASQTKVREFEQNVEQERAEKEAAEKLIAERIAAEKTAAEKEAAERVARIQAISEFWNICISERAIVCEKYRLAKKAIDKCFLNKDETSLIVDAAAYTGSSYVDVKDAVGDAVARIDNAVRVTTVKATTAVADLDSKSFRMAVQKSANADAGVGVSLKQYWVNASSAFKREKNIWEQVGYSWNVYAEQCRVILTCLENCKKTWGQVRFDCLSGLEIDNLKSYRDAINASFQQMKVTQTAAKSQLAEAQKAVEGAEAAFQALKTARENALR